MPEGFWVCVGPEDAADHLLMSTSLCSEETTPVTYQACVMTKDCVLSEWSPWGVCSKDCYDPNGPKGRRTRSRRLSQFPVGGGTACPQLEETQPCSPQGDDVHPCTVYVPRQSASEGPRLSRFCASSTFIGNWPTKHTRCLHALIDG